MRKALARFLLLSAAVSIGWISRAEAYPELIRLGYVQCQTCHTSSLGSGLLNAYGKSVRTSLSAFQRKDETVSESMLNANVFLRYLWIESERLKDHFLMQLDTAARADLTKDFGVETIVGLVPERVKTRPGAPRGVLGKSFVLRRLIVDHSLGNEETRLVFGRDFLPRGINHEDHTSFLRSFNRQGVTDYPTQLRLEFRKEKDLAHFGAYAPSGEEQSNAREWGLFSRYERTLAEKLAAGAQVIVGQTSEIRRTSGDLFARYAFSSSVGVLADLQWVERSLRNANQSFGQKVVFLEPFYVPFEWTVVRYRAEKLLRESPFQDNAFRHQLSLQVKLLSEVTVIGGAEKTRRNGNWGDALYTIQLFSQL